MSIDICRVSDNNNIVCFSKTNRNETFVSQSTSTQAMVDTLYLLRYEREKKLKSGEKGGGQKP